MEGESLANAGLFSGWRIATLRLPNLPGATLRADQMPGKKTGNQKEEGLPACAYGGGGLAMRRTRPR